MNYKFIFIFGIFRTIGEVYSIEYGFECVKRKSGVCKAFNVSEDFDEFIDLHAVDYGNERRITTIIEIDYIENKYSYDLGKTNETKKYYSNNYPVVEILFSEHKDSKYIYRLVLGEKHHGLAYVQIDEVKQFVEYNNYSPDLPYWPFAFNVTVDFDSINPNKTKLEVYTKNGDGFDKETPFLSGGSEWIAVRCMSIRSRNKYVKLVAFYDCSKKYGFNCGTEKTNIITDCKEQISPLGSGFFNNFIDMSKFNRLGNEKSAKNIFDYNEIFGIYRRNNDNMHILFTTSPYESETYVRITIGDEISVRVRTYDNDTYEYYEKTAVKKGWNQSPSEPNFIKVNLSSVFKYVSIHNLDADSDEPLLKMKLCNYFDRDTIQYMSVTSNRFKTTDLYYDCCLPNDRRNCHVYTQAGIYYGKTMNRDEFIFDSTTIRLPEEETTLDSKNTPENMLNEDNATNLSIKTTVLSQITTIETTGRTTDITAITNQDEHNKINEMKTLKGDEKTKTFLDVRRFHETESTLYIYANETHTDDDCPNEIEDVKLLDITKANNLALVTTADPKIKSN